MSSSITLIALSAAGGLILGWALCHIAHTSARSDARHFRQEAELLRSKAIRIDERRLTAQAEANALFHELQELRDGMTVEVGSAAEGDAQPLDDDSAIDLDEAERATQRDTELETDEVEPPARPTRTRQGGEPGRLAEAFGSD